MYIFLLFKRLVCTLPSKDKVLGASPFPAKAPVKVRKVFVQLILYKNVKTVSFGVELYGYFLRTD